MKYILFFLLFMILNCCGCKIITTSSAKQYNLTSHELELLKKKANNGNVEASLRLVQYYEFVEYNVEEQIRWLKVPAKLGDTVSQYNLAAQLIRSNNLSHRQEGVYWYKKAANSGDKESQYELAGVYEAGEIIDKDYHKAKYWYEKAALSGYVYAMIKMSEYSMQGKGGKKDIAKAYSWLLFAELNSNPKSITGKDVRNRKNDLASNLSNEDINQANIFFKEINKLTANKEKNE